MGRRNTLHIYAYKDLENLLQPLLDYLMHKSMFKIEYHPFNPGKHALIYEDKGLEVYTIPLKHSAPTAGFLFKEKTKEHNIKKEMIKAFNIRIKDILKIKQGADFTTEDGNIIPNSRLATAPQKPRSYSYITDTAYKPKIAEWLQDVDLLYHEATFADEATLHISKTLHSTAGQAAEIAQLCHAKQLIIGHFSSRYKEVKIVEAAAKAIFKNTTAVHDGMSVEIQ